MPKSPSRRRPPHRKPAPPLSRRSALELLAACPDDNQPVVHNFPIELLVDLIGAGLVTVKAEKKACRRARDRGCGRAAYGGWPTGPRQTGQHLTLMRSPWSPPQTRGRSGHRRGGISTPATPYRSLSPFASSVRPSASSASAVTRALSSVGAALANSRNSALSWRIKVRSPASND
jgi:hypothetical protein